MPFVYNARVLIRVARIFGVLALVLSVHLQCDFQCLTSLSQLIVSAPQFPACHHSSTTPHSDQDRSKPKKDCERHATADEAVITAKSGVPATVSAVAPAVALP